MTRRRDKREKARAKSLPPKLPAGAVRADQSQQVPNNSYCSPPAWYVDIDFRCVDCGAQETWTASQQKWYYEVAKGSLYATAVRCRSCRQRRRHEREQQQATSAGQQPKPSNPLLKPDRVLKAARAAAEPAILDAGFVFQRRDAANPHVHRCAAYSGENALLFIRWDGCHRTFVRLVAELVDFHGPDLTITEADFSDLVDPATHGANAELDRRLRRFALAIRDFFEQR